MSVKVARTGFLIDIPVNRDFNENHSAIQAVIEQFQRLSACCCWKPRLTGRNPKRKNRNGMRVYPVAPYKAKSAITCRRCCTILEAKRQLRKLGVKWYRKCSCLDE